MIDLQIMRIPRLYKKILFCCFIGNIFLGTLSAKIQPILQADIKLDLVPILHWEKNEYYDAGINTPLSQSPVYGNYHLMQLKATTDLSLNVGFILRPDRKFAGHSFFGTYKIKYLTLAENTLKTRFFNDFCNVYDVREQTEKYSDYLRQNLSRFLWQTQLMPFDRLLYSSGQLINRLLFAYSYSILDALDFSTALSFTSLLPENPTKHQRSKAFERSEIYTYNLGFFLRPLDLAARPKFDEELEMSFFVNYSFHSMPNAKTHFDDSLPIAETERQKLKFGNNKNIISGNWGLFYEKKLSKLNLYHSTIYNHQITFYNERSGVEKKETLTTGDEYAIDKNTLPTKNDDSLENTFSIEFLLPRKNRKKHQEKITLTLGNAFFIEYSPKNLWVHPNHVIDKNNLSLPHHHFSIQSSPFPIFEARIFDHIKNSLMTEIKYLFHETTSVFFHYQWTTIHYYRLTTKAKNSESYTNVYTQSIAKNDNVEDLHAVKVGFLFSNDFVEKIQPYFFYAKSFNGILSPKKNLDFWGVGVQFSYFLDPPK